MATVAPSSAAASSLWGLGSSHHRHGVNCGHIVIQHGDHVGFLADGQLECVAATNDIHPHWMDNLCFEALPGSTDPAGTPDGVHAHGISGSLSSSLCCDEKITHMHAHLHLDQGITRKFTLSKSVDMCALPGSLDSACKLVSPRCEPSDDGSHSHSHSCGHELIPHGDHYDYLVPTQEGYRLDHQHVASDGRSGHVDDHGRLIRREGPGPVTIDRAVDGVSRVGIGLTDCVPGGVTPRVVAEGNSPHREGKSPYQEGNSPGVCRGGERDFMGRSSSPPTCSTRAHGAIFRFLSRGMALPNLALFPGHADKQGDAMEKASLLWGQDGEIEGEGDEGDDCDAHADVSLTAKSGGAHVHAGSSQIATTTSSKEAGGGTVHAGGGIEHAGGGIGSEHAQHGAIGAGDVVVNLSGQVAAPLGIQAPTRLALTVNGICCPSEVPLIERILKRLPGVASVTVTVPTRRTVVMHDPDKVTASAIVDALNEAGLDASIHRVGDGEDDASLGHRLPPWDTVLSGALIAVSIFSLLYHPLKYVALGAVALRLPRMVLKMVASLRRLILDVNTLMAIAVAGAVAIGDYIEAGTVVFLFALAEWLELRASEKSRRAMSAMLALAPERATLAATGESLPVEDIRVGARLVVKPGEKLPIDGIVVSGASSVTEANLTGESRPVSKRRGSRVYAGTINQSGAFTMQTTALASDSAIARMVRLVEEAQMQRTKSERAVESFAKFYTPAVVLAAILVAVIPVAMGRDYEDWLYLALVLLVVACPCALVISTPVTAVCGLAQAARLGILVKGGTHLETLGRVRSVALDKTGTLTEGHFRVRHLELVAEASTAVAPHDPENHDKDHGRERGEDCDSTSSGRSDSMTLPQALYWLSAVESCSSHPLADALVTFAKKNGVEVGGAAVEDFSVLPGEGVRATVDGQAVFVGNNDLAARLGWCGVAGKATLDRVGVWEMEGGTVGWVGFEGRPIAVFSLADMPRKEAGEAVARLASLGVSVTMLTGDGWGAARVVAQQVGIDESQVFACLHPEHKVARVQELKAGLPKRGRNKLAMVGDGINDAPALAAADLGVAMGVGGTAVAMETGDVALMTNNLTRLADAVQLGRSCRMTVIVNILFSVATKLAFIGITLAGWTTLWMAVVADVGTSLVVTYNGTRVLKSTRPRSAECVSAASGGGEEGEGGCAGNDDLEGQTPGHKHGHGHGLKAVVSHLWRHLGGHGHAHGAGGCGDHKQHACQVPLIPANASAGGCCKEKSCGSALPVRSTQPTGQGCCAGKACGGSNASGAASGNSLGALPSPGAESVALTATRSAKLACCASKSCEPAPAVAAATAPESACCASKSCESAPAAVAAAPAPAVVAAVPAPAVVAATAPKSGCCASRSCEPAPAVTVAAPAPAVVAPAPAPVVAAATSPTLGCCASKSCESAPAAVAVAPAPAVVAAAPAPAVAAATAPKSGCCASKSCGPAPVVAAATAPESGCCASKACKPAPAVTVAAPAPAVVAAAPAPAVVAATAPKSGCCASKACKPAPAVTVAAPAPAVVAATAHKSGCCASKSCEPAPAVAVAAPAPAVAAATAPESGCCASKSCEPAPAAPVAAPSPAVAAATAPKSGCCASKSCKPAPAVMVAAPASVVAAATAHKSGCCASKSCEPAPAVAVAAPAPAVAAATAPESGCCASKSCEPGPAVPVAAPSPAVAAATAPKSGCCASKSCEPAPEVAVAAPAPALAAATALKSGCCASKSCEPAPAMAAAAPAPAVAAAAPAPAVAAATAPKSGCCASKSCESAPAVPVAAPSPAVAAATAPKSGCCASKSCGPAPVMVAATAPKSGCCASKACGR
eukprot:jgi/Mesvir1/13417/Mv16498-RA.1